MANELIRLIDPESARAIEEAAKAAGKAIDAVAETGSYVTDVVGDLPRDLVGIIGDWAKHKRARRSIELEAETEKLLHERGVKDRSEVSPSIAIPLIAAAINEDRDGLKELWARLLAATLDPARAGYFRSAFIDAAKRMDPLDARLLHAATAHGGAITEETRKHLCATLHVSRDELEVSIQNLEKLEMLVLPSPPNGAISAIGREFLRAVR